MPHEVLNALLMGERRKRITADLTKAFLEELNLMKVEVDRTVAYRVFGPLQELCRKHRLTGYDAAYLELAMRGKNALATVDDDLMKAAQAEGIMLL